MKRMATMPATAETVCRIASVRAACPPASTGRPNMAAIVAGAEPAWPNPEE